MSRLDMDDRTLLGRPERSARPATGQATSIFSTLNRTLLVLVFGAAMFTVGLFAAPGMAACRVLA